MLSLKIFLSCVVVYTVLWFFGEAIVSTARTRREKDILEFCIGLCIFLTVIIGFVSSLKAIWRLL